MKELVALLSGRATMMSNVGPASSCRVWVFLIDGNIVAVNLVSFGRP